MEKLTIQLLTTGSRVRKDNFDCVQLAVAGFISVNHRRHLWLQ